MPFLTLRPFATVARNAYIVLRFIMIMTQVTLFCAVTPDLEISFSYMSVAVFMFDFKWHIDR